MIDENKKKALEDATKHLADQAANDGEDTERSKDKRGEAEKDVNQQHGESSPD